MKQYYKPRTFPAGTSSRACSSLPIRRYKLEIFIRVICSPFLRSLSVTEASTISSPLRSYKCKCMSVIKKKIILN